jgi:Flp pilus assembly CpaF family ATPase
MTVHYDSRKLLVTIKNAARLEHEKDVILTIEGYRTGAEREQRDAHLVRNEMAVNEDMLVVGELRVLTGMSRQRK